MNTQEFIDALHEQEKIDQMLIDLRIVTEMQTVKGDVSNADEDLQEDHVESKIQVLGKGNQTINQNPAIAIQSKAYLEVGTFIKEVEKLTSRTMMNKGTISALTDIAETGIYTGVDLQNAPIQGPVMIMAFRDNSGNYGMFLVGNDGVLHMGQQAANVTSPTWAAVGGSGGGIDAAMKAILSTLQFNAGKGTSLDIDKRTDHISIDIPLVLNQPQDLDAFNIQELLASKSFITIGNAVKIELALKQVLEDEAMMTKTKAITSMDNIDDRGIWQGTDVRYAPTQGQIIVMSFKDKNNNMGYMLMDNQNKMHTGGKPNGGTLKWNTFVDSADIGDLHSLIAGKDLTEYLTTLHKDVDALKSSAGTATKEPATGTWAISKVSCDATGQLITIDFNNFTQPPTGNISIEDGSPHTFKFIKAPSSPKDIPVATTWVWVTVPGGGKNVRAFSNGKEMSADTFNAYINSGAWVDITYANGKYNFSNVRIPSGASTSSKSILADGSVEMDSGYVPTKDMNIMTKKAVEKEIREFRTTIVMDTASTEPTRAEIITAFKKLPHFDFSKDDDFYIKSVNKDKFTLVKYRADAGSKDEASAGRFWIEKLTLAS